MTIHGVDVADFVNEFAGRSLYDVTVTSPNS